MSGATPVVERVDQIIATYEARPTALIMILQGVQREYSYLPEEALRRVSQRMDLALSQIYGVATFYKAFSLEPKGRHQICVCTGTACHVRASQSVLEKLERDLHVKRGQTTADGEFSLETVNCVGCCALGPVVVADEKYWGHMTVGDVDKLVNTLRAKDQAKPS
jgi:NADH-quinone oxidoreductase subunit E